MRVLATAGHVDHGKSTLVLALTGTDPDRLAEEKARGLTIDLGFAACTLPSSEDVAFVDVPGHVRFIKNMLAGVGAVDACLFVVAATEGWKPQSEEHLRILSLLGVTNGVIALTKVGLVDDEWRELAELDVRDHVAGTFLAGAELVAVDAVDGTGVASLQAALGRLVASVPAAADRGWPRLWVDRSFAVRGAGTVVTGTLTGGPLRVEEEVGVEPGGLVARVRRLHSHHVALETAAPGRRLAVNLTGVAHDRVGRGQAVVRPGQWHRARVVDASLSVLASLDHAVERRGAYAAYVGSGEFPVRLRVLGEPSVAPGATGLVRMWLPVGLPLLPGDRFVLREAGRSETVGGGEVLDVEPVRPASRAAPSRSVERVIAERGWVDAAHLERLTGVALAPTLGRWVVDKGELSAARAALRSAVANAGAPGVDVAALDDRQRAVLAAGLDGVVVRSGRAVDASLTSDGLPPAAATLLAGLEASPFSPPDVAPAERGAARELQRRGLAVEAGPVWFAASAVTSAAGVVARLLAAAPGGVTVSEVREALGSSRKHVVPLLEHFDASGVTRRRGDVRVGGPRLPAADADGIGAPSH
ncbi:MAG TPA: selenocysteine-specific translation elongation factor [Acidimicrobiales bacterium]|nr:selenocysteine-specific translation elongation factor [Acidimicrobiales bacterium]